jgi:hypothetical protein
MRLGLFVLLLLVSLGILSFGVYSYLNPQKPIEDKPLWKKQIEVSAKQMWVDTGVDVTDKYVRIDYTTGQWSNGGKKPGFCDGRGFDYANEDYKDLMSRLVAPNRALASLVAKVDEEIIFVGNSYEGKLGKGNLYLSINDRPGYFEDNEGALIVTVSFWKESQ